MRGFYDRSTAVFDFGWRIFAGHALGGLLLSEGALVCVFLLRAGVYVFPGIFVFPRNVGVSPVFELPALPSGN